MHEEEVDELEQYTLNFNRIFYDSMLHKNNKFKKKNDFLGGRCGGGIRYCVLSLFIYYKFNILKIDIVFIYKLINLFDGIYYRNQIKN